MRPCAVTLLLVAAACSQPAKQSSDSPRHGADATGTTTDTSTGVETRTKTSAATATKTGTQIAAATKHYAVVLSYQDAAASAEESHTFATFVKASGDKIAEQVDISWEPAASGGEPVCLFPCDPEPGKSYALAESLAFGKTRGRTLKKWGPVEIPDALYAKAAQQLATLRAGKIKYIAIDNGTRANGTAINCMHAVSDLTGGAPLDTGLNWGFAGSDLVFKHLQSAGGATSTPAPAWVATALGIADVP